MAIDFSQVKKIQISEGEVTKVQINGVTVWENAPVLDSISLSGQTTSLNRGSAFSFGGTVTAHYSNGSTANVTSSTTFSGYNMSIAGTYTVTASYTENGITKTATYQLTINKAWTQIWSGSKTCNSTGTTIDVITLSSLSGTVTFRVTWSCSASGAGGTTEYFNNNGSTKTSTKPSNPFQFNLDTASNRNHIVGVSRYNGSSTGVYRELRWKSSSKNFFLYGGSGSNEGGQSASMTVTKIEQYY